MKRIIPKRKSDFSLKTLFQPMMATMLLSFVYNIFYIYGTLFLGASWFSYVFIVLLAMASSVGLYWICTKIWKVSCTLSKEVLLPILVVEGLLLIFTLGILAPLHSIVYAMDQWFISIPYQVVCAILIVLAQPLQLCMFSGLTQNVYGVKPLGAYVKDKFLHAFKEIWNRYCLILLMIIFVDTLVNGLFTMQAGFDAYSILSNILLFGNPMFSWMFAFMMWAGAGLSTGAMMSLLILFIVGVVYLTVECNFLKKAGDAWIDHGAKTVKTHKKKK